MGGKSLSLRGYDSVVNPFSMLLEGRKPGCEYHELSISISNAAGSFCQIGEKLVEREIRILKGVHRQSGDKVLWTLFVEVPESVPIADVLEKISSISVVSELRQRKMGETDTFGKFLFPLQLFDSRMALLADFMLFGIKKAAVDVLMSGGDLIIYTQGMYTGKSLLNALRERFSEKLHSVEETLNFAEDAFGALGWGVLEFSELSPKAKTGSVTVRESLEHKWSSKTNCHFVRGFITGMLRQVFDDETIEIRETKCESRGDSHCEYKFA